jgi:predicted amino acid racemase
MNRLENFEAPRGQVNSAVEEINELENAEIRGILTAENVVNEGDVITSEDFDAVRARAAYLAGNVSAPVSSMALILNAYVDRMEHMGKIGDAQMKGMSDEAIQAVHYVRKGYRLTEAEIGIVRKSNVPFSEWIQTRTSLKEGLKDGHVVVDETDNVIAFGETPEEALRNAQEKR